MNPPTATAWESLYQKNLARLRQQDPALAQRVETCPEPRDVGVALARDGMPVPRVNKISLHSQYDPRKEADLLIQSHRASAGKQMVFFGLGFGYHVLAWLNRHPGTVWVIEPSLPLFKSFLQRMDLAPFASRVRFFVDVPPPCLLSRHEPQSWDLFTHPPSGQLHRDYFNRLEEGRGLLEELQRHRLRVLVVPPIYGGSLPTARYCAEALELLGHEVALVECDRFADSFFAVQKVTPNPDHSRVLSKRFMEMMDEVILAKAAEFQPDLILGLAQAPLGGDAIARLRVLQAPIVFWFVEDFRTLTYWKNVARHYDHFFTIQRGEFLDALKTSGAPRVYYLPQACHPPVHHPQQLTSGEQKQFGAEVSFMGAAYCNRLRAFQQLLDFNLKIWGTGWDPASAYGRCLQKNGERVSSEECVKIFNGGTINLNLHSSTFHEGVNPNGDFVNPRTFEIAACGAFQLVDQRSELADLFRVNEEIAVFSSIAELRERIGFYLNHPEERRHLAEAGRRRVLREHTMRHRMQELLLEVFTGKRDWLQERWAGRQSALDTLVREAGETTALGEYLKQFEGHSDFSLQTVQDRIEQGEGKLSKTELLLLMVNQVMK